jgi:Serine incorporator (Serinc)
MWIGSFFIPNEFFLGYARWAVYLAGIYLFVQMVSLIDAFYLWAEFWAKKFDEGNKCYGCLLIFVTLAMYSATGYILFFSYTKFWVAGCTANKILLILMTAFPVIFTTLILMKFHPQGSLITAGGISIYGTFLVWTAFISFPNKKAGETCNPVIGSSTSMYLQLGTGLLVALICTFYWSLSAKASKAYEDSGVKVMVAEPEEDEEKINSENDKNV